MRNIKAYKKKLITFFFSHKIYFKKIKHVYSITILFIPQFDSEEGDAETREERGGDEPNPKRRHFPNLLLYIFILLPFFFFFFFAFL